MHVGPIPKNCQQSCLIAQAVAGLPIGLVITDPAGRILWLNHAAERLLGTQSGACVGRPATQVFKDPQLVSFWEKSERDENLRAELSVHWPEPLELKVSSMRCCDDGHEIGRALLFCDVTSERAVQVELSQAVAKRLLSLTSGHMPPDAVANLTQQEIRVLRLVGRGLSNEDIADQMTISASTVRAHLKGLYRKLGLGSRAEAVSYAIRNSLA
jgi:DNA-binding CsgD family transcriptional regulator